MTEAEGEIVKGRRHSYKMRGAKGGLQGKHSCTESLECLELAARSGGGGSYHSNV